MKYFTDVLIILVGLILLISIALSVLAGIGYFFGDLRGGDVLWLLQYTVPAILVSVAIGWWRPEVFRAMIEWIKWG